MDAVFAVFAVGGVVAVGLIKLARQGEPQRGVVLDQQDTHAACGRVNSRRGRWRHRRSPRALRPAR
jgi:hypothetical protein